MLFKGLPQGSLPRLERPGPLRERVYETLLHLIGSRSLPPGTHLVESELATRLGVSRQPVHEALQRLDAEGWVDLRPAQGAFVHEPTGEETDQLFVVRTLLETEGARLAAVGPSAQGLQRLDELCATGEAAVAADDVDAVVAANATFHACVMELAGNAVLAELASRVEHRVRRSYTPIVRQAWVEHRELVAAIAARDDTRAEQVMRAHTQDARTRFPPRS
ncbi:GntR family transcriptional regulator [Streptomyces sp. MI02-7b]|uniref:GntR family transcriptional regulator n=1 Tax=Streptomyces sp. MI02-7b TaxID=462941 RepID=UPI0029B8E7B5|nr:GntR family transcriptional regulator [Streptomyces sp. MI02-7b]MDX3075416.1 GntR family transcriptional regulator [Streptomyces sp. MI02-7b]